MTQDNKKISKLLSYALRHRPDAIGIKLDDHGWVGVDDLIKAVNNQGQFLDRSLLEIVVFNNDKQRFAFSADGLSIRANQGHSIDVDLALEAIEPPHILYHGTATRFLSSIKSHGLLKKNRQHVHLSALQETAVSVGQRHGKPIILNIQAKHMYDDGHQFYLSKNGVWLTDHVPIQFINY